MAHQRMPLFPTILSVVVVVVVVVGGGGGRHPTVIDLSEIRRGYVEHGWNTWRYDPCKVPGGLMLQSLTSSPHFRPSLSPFC